MPCGKRRKGKRKRKEKKVRRIDTSKPGWNIL
jgi:hypothetical protein